MPRAHRRKTGRVPQTRRPDEASGHASSAARPPSMTKAFPSVCRSSRRARRHWTTRSDEPVRNVMRVVDELRAGLLERNHRHAGPDAARHRGEDRLAARPYLLGARRAIAGIDDACFSSMPGSRQSAPVQLAARKFDIS
jgi:hypothetical protein